MARRSSSNRSGHQIPRTSIRRRARRSTQEPLERGQLRSYEPITIDAQAARRGVTWRLLGAICTLLVTALCLGMLLWGAQRGLAQAALVMLGAGSLSMATAMLLSARREEQVHQLASDLHAQAQLTHEPQDAAYDGTVG